MDSINNAIRKTERLCAGLESVDIDRSAFIEQCTRLVAAEVGCSRSGIWVFLDSARGRAMHCLGL